MSGGSASSVVATAYLLPPATHLTKLTRWTGLTRLDSQLQNTLTVQCVAIHVDLQQVLESAVKPKMTLQVCLTPGVVIGAAAYYALKLDSQSRHHLTLHVDSLCSLLAVH